MQQDLKVILSEVPDPSAIIGLTRTDSNANIFGGIDNELGLVTLVNGSREVYNIIKNNFTLLFKIISNNIHIFFINRKHIFLLLS